LAGENEENFAGAAFGVREVSWWSKKEEQKNPEKPKNIQSCRLFAIKETKENRNCE
jgi:hypothetical protein